MATWDFGDKFKFRSDHSVYDKDDSDYFEWAYQTTSDSLTIRKINVKQSCAYGGRAYPEETSHQIYGVDEAHALYRCLRNWIKTYEGETILKVLDSQLPAPKGK